jgi:hypothetical protein
MRRRSCEIVYAERLFDGVFAERDGDRLVFVRLDPPTSSDLARIAHRIRHRTWVREARRAAEERAPEE